MFGLRSPRTKADALVRQVEDALGTCAAVGALRERPEDPEALDLVVTELRVQADLVGGSDDPADLAEVEAIEELERRITARRLGLLGIDPRELRRRSLAELAHAGLVPSERRAPSVLDAAAGRRRTAENACDRARALLAVLHAVHGARAIDVGRSLERRGLVPWTTPQERTFLKLLATRPDDDRELAAHRAWIGRRVEGLHALGWALGLLPDLDATGFSDVHPDAFAPIAPAEAAGTPTSLRLRTEAELLGRLDVLTCAHVALQERELRGGSTPLPSDVVPGAIAERRRALDWLLSVEAWDAIDVETAIRAERRR